VTGIFLRELLFPWSEQDQLDGRTGIFYIHMFSDICMFYYFCELHYNYLMFIINHTFLIVCLSIEWRQYIKIWNILFSHMCMYYYFCE